VNTAKYQVTATELAALLNHPLNHVIRVCLLKLLLQGNLKNVSKHSKGVKLKRVSSPYIRYQRCLARTYKQATFAGEAVRGDVGHEFLNELFERMKRLGVFDHKGFFGKKWKVTKKGQKIIELNRNRLRDDKDTLKPGLNVKLLRAFAIDPSYKRLLSDRVKAVCRVRVLGNANQKDWFHATWSEANRYEAMRKGMRNRFGLFDL